MPTTCPPECAPGQACEAIEAEERHALVEQRVDLASGSALVNAKLQHGTQKEERRERVRVRRQRAIGAGNAAA